jgi:transcription-repair coupling factor (superfamily II helicase)
MSKYKDILQNKTVSFTPIFRDYTGLLMINLLKSTNKNIIYISRDLGGFESLESFMRFFKPESLVFRLNLNPSKPEDFSPFEYNEESKKTIAVRFLNLLGLLQAKNQAILHLTVEDFVRKYIPPQAVLQYAFRLKTDEKIDYAYFKMWLEMCGFEPVDTVYETGEFVIRGGLADIGFVRKNQFGRYENCGFRIEFVGTRVNKIRVFDLDTQVSKNELEELVLVPVSNVILNKQTQAIFKAKYPYKTGKMDERYEQVLDGIRVLSLDNLFECFYDNLALVCEFMPNEDYLLVFDFGVYSLIEDVFLQTKGSLREFMSQSELNSLENRASNIIFLNPFN